MSMARMANEKKGFTPKIWRERERKKIKFHHVTIQMGSSVFTVLIGAWDYLCIPSIYRDPLLPSFNSSSKAGFLFASFRTVFTRRRIGVLLRLLVKHLRTDPFFNVNAQDFLLHLHVCKGRREGEVGGSVWHHGPMVIPLPRSHSRLMNRKIWNISLSECIVGITDIRNFLIEK